MTRRQGVVAIDIGGSFAKGGLVLVDEPGKVTGRAEHATGSGDAEKSFAAIASCVRDIEVHAADAGVDILGYGFCSPGPMDVARTHVTKPQLGWSEFPLRSRLADEFGSRPIRIENDANTAALGCWLNTGRRSESLLLVTVSTGVGAGFVLPGGLLLTGHTGNAAELGHIPFGDNPCSFQHSPGCLEGAVAGSGIEERFGVRAEDAPRELRRQLSEELGSGLVAAVHLYDPGALVLMGSVAYGFQAADERDGCAPDDCFLSVVRKRIKSDSVHHVDLNVSFSPFGGDTGIIGAAALVATTEGAGTV